MSRMVRKIIIVIALLLAISWATLVLYLSPILPEPWRLLATALFLSSMFIGLLWRSQRSLMLPLNLGLFLLIGFLWTTLTPSNDREWAPEVAKLPWAEVNGDQVTIHNIRNFSYRTETDFDPSYYSKTYKLSELTETDFIASYWTGKAIAHIMVSFGFNNRDFIAFSIETRKEVGEQYSAINGFFRNYELTYVVADERDLLRLRTTFRNPPEQVYLLRTDIPLENGRKLFKQYLKTINELREHPEFYNSLTTNCTTRILSHVETYSNRVRYNWKILASGYLPDYLYEIGGVAPYLTFDDLMKRSLINERSLAAGDAADYSVRIREGIPAPQPAQLDSDGKLVIGR